MTPSCNTEDQNIRRSENAIQNIRISEYAIQNIRLLEYAILNIKICNTEYQNMLYRISEYIHISITKVCIHIFHAAFLCTDYAMYVKDIQNIFHTTQRILVNMICNIYNIHIKNTQYSYHQILEFTKHIISENRIWNTTIFSTNNK